MSALTVPADLQMWIQETPDRSTLVMARDALAIPTTISGKWDGPDVPAGMPGPPYILFSFGWHRDFAGHGYEGVARMAAILASHLAALHWPWPAQVAHVRGLPMVDTRSSWLVSPEFIPAAVPPAIDAGLAEKIAASLDGSAPDVAAAIRDLTSGTCGCGCECCGN